MKEWLRLRSMNMYPRLVLGFLLVITPMYAAGLYMNEQGARSVRHEISQSLKARTYFFMQTFEQELRGTSLLLSDMALDTDLQKLSTIAPAMSGFDQIQAVTRLQSRMRLLQHSNQYITQAQAYIPLIGKTIEATSYEKAMTEGQIAALQRASQEVVSQWEDLLLLGQTYPDILREGSQPSFAVGVALSSDKIGQALRQLAGAGGDAVLISTDARWQIASSDEASAIGRRLVAETEPVLANGAPNSGISRMTIDDRQHWVSIEQSPFLNAMLIVSSPEAQTTGRLGAYRYLLIGLSAFSLMAVALFSYWIYRRFHQPLHRIVRAFRKVEQGNLQVSLQHHHRDEFRYLYAQFNQMVEQLQTLIGAVYEQKIHAQRSELKQLQSQINPHFLYNSFFTLHQMAEAYDVDNITRFTRHLGEYFRFITRSASDDVTLAAEMAHAQAYTEIQSIRFHNRITTVWGELPADVERLAVPVLILQPLIENAFEHGLEHKEASGRVQISCRLEGDMLRIAIEDNGDSLSEERLRQLQHVLKQTAGHGSEVTGMYNVHRRLQLRYGPEGGLVLARSALGGLRVDVRLRYGKERKHHDSTVDRR